MSKAKKNTIRCQVIVAMSTVKPGEVESHFGIPFTTTEKGTLIGDVHKDFAIPLIRGGKLKALEEIQRETLTLPDEEEEGVQEEEEVETEEDEIPIDQKVDALREDLGDYDRSELKAYIADHNLPIKVSGMTDSIVIEKIIEQMLETGQL